jgi:hypothetical protein
MSIIGDWYDENYVIPLTKTVEEQKELLKECLDIIKGAHLGFNEFQRENIIKKIKEKLA